MKDPDGTESLQVDDNSVDEWSPGADGDDVTPVDEMTREPESAMNPADDYMPVRKIVSDLEQLKQEELRQNVYRPPPVVQVKTVPARLYSIPIHLTAYAYDTGDISSFPSPKKDDFNKLGAMSVYYLRNRR